jgi:alkanesulfonate monooxygenase SsuD/methylene tetrahydromethanopterin reductase-like flavin-dependent oxidoreductase (luciferase family)
VRAGIVVLPEHRWWVAEPKWRAVEEYGFDHAWTYDHLGWRTLVDGPWFSAMPTLTAAAMVTSRIRLGTFVATPNYRHPVPFARELLALDDISDGRLVLGVGSGGGGKDGYDTTVLGGPRITPRARAERFGEFVELLDLLLTRDLTTWRGEHYSAVDARSAPGCVQHPRAPFVVAANGPKAMQVAARFGQGWVTTGENRDDEEAWWRSLGELSARFDDTLAEVGRASTSVDRYLQLDASPSYSLASVERFRDAVGRAADLGFTDVIAHWPRPEGIYAGHESVLEEVADEVLPELDRMRSLD